MQSREAISMGTYGGKHAAATAVEERKQAVQEYERDPSPESFAVLSEGPRQACCGTEWSG